MPTLVSEIVVQAFREGNFIAVGESTTAEELAEAVPRLRNLINSLLGIELGEQYRDWFVPTTNTPEELLQHPLTPTGTGETGAEPWQYPPPNSRLIVNVTAIRTLYFPAYPRDGARMAYVDMGSTAIVTLNGNGRKIEAALTVASTAGAGLAALSGRKWLYRADTGNWLRIDAALASGDPVPLPEEFDDLLVCGLAIRLAPRFQTKLDDSTALRFADMLNRLKLRYKQSEHMPTSHEMRQLFRSDI